MHWFLQKSLFLLPVLYTTVLLSCKTPAEPCVNSNICLKGFACNIETGECVPESELNDAGVSMEPDVCPTDTHACVAAPEGWHGPVLAMGEAVDTKPAGCNLGYEEALLAKSDFEAKGECSCSCPGNATGVQCVDAVLTVFNKSAAGSCEDQSTLSSSKSRSFQDGATCQTLYDFKDRECMRVTLPTVNEVGTCAAPVESNTLTTEFHKQESLCTPTGRIAQGICKEKEQTCLPKEEGTKICIFQSGEKACPAGFPTRSVRYTKAKDERTCSECSCPGAQSGASCGGTVRLLEKKTSLPNSECSFTSPFNWFGPVEEYTSTTQKENRIKFIAGGALGVYGAPTIAPIFSCEAGKEGGDVSGEASADGVNTICCI